jgi:hypothetical protein
MSSFSTTLKLGPMKFILSLYRPKLMYCLFSNLLCKAGLGWVTVLLVKLVRDLTVLQAL